MKNTKFKALVHCDLWVDANLLEKGIYSSPKPFIYSSDTTIESLISNARTIKTMTGDLFLSESYFDNLSNCKLVDIEILEI